MAKNVTLSTAPWVMVRANGLGEKILMRLSIFIYEAGIIPLKDEFNKKEGSYVGIFLPRSANVVRAWLLKNMKVESPKVSRR